MGVELCFLLMAFLHLLFECRDLRATPHLCISEFSSLRDAFKELTPCCKSCIFMESRTQKSRMQTHTGLSKTGDGVRLTQRHHSRRQAFPSGQLLQLPERRRQVLPESARLCPYFPVVAAGVNHWLWSVQCLAYLGRFHTPRNASKSRT